MSTSELPVPPGTWWSLLPEQDRLLSVDQGASWPIKSRRPWANKTAWNPAGRVLHLWQTELYETIKVIINDPGNYNRIYGDGSHHPGLGRHLWMVADKAIYQEAHPTIVIACKDKRFAKNTIQLLEDIQSFKRLNLGFRFLAHNSKIQYKALSGGLYPQSEFLESLCGIEVFLPSVQTSLDAPSFLWPRATIGGVLRLGQPYYALTVAHVLYPCNPETDDETASWSGSESDSGTDESELSNESYKSFGSVEAVAGDEPRGKDIRATPSTNDQKPVSSMHPAFVDTRPRETIITSQMESSESHKGRSDVSLGCIGNLYSTIQPEDVSRINPSHDSSIWVCRERDWALIKIIDPRFCRPNQIQHPAGHTLMPKSISPKSAPPRGPVVTAAGVSGIHESNCSGILCGLTLPGTALMVDAWVVSSGSQPGDSGAWVLDPQNGDIYAITVATSSNPSFTYVIPAEDTFSSIMARCGMVLGSIDEMLPTTITAAEIEAALSFPASNTVKELRVDDLSITSLQRTGFSVATRPSSRASSVVTSRLADGSSRTTSTASSEVDMPLGGKGDFEEEGMSIKSAHLQEQFQSPIGSSGLPDPMAPKTGIATPTDLLDTNQKVPFKSATAGLLSMGSKQIWLSSERSGQQSTTKAKPRLPGKPVGGVPAQSRSGTSHLLSSERRVPPRTVEFARERRENGPNRENPSAAVAEPKTRETPASIGFRLFPPSIESRDPAEDDLGVRASIGGTQPRSEDNNETSDNSPAITAVPSQLTRQSTAILRPNSDILEMPTIEEGEASSNPAIRGTAGDVEILDSRYMKRQDARKFFTTGRVFALLWHENPSTGSRGTDLSSEKAVAVRRGRFGEEIYSSIRRMVVIKEGHGYCWCLSITTYNGGGVTKPGMSPVDREGHAVIYMSDAQPYRLPEEENLIIKKDIAVDKASADQKLHPMSRLNFNSVFTVEHNVKVLNIGKVAKNSMPDLMGYWRNSMS